MVPNRRTKRKSQSVDSRSKISGMTEKSRHPGDFRAVFSLPLNGSITLRSSPRQSLSRGPEVSKKQRKSKNLDSRLKISGMTEGGHS